MYKLFFKLLARSMKVIIVFSAVTLFNLANASQKISLCIPDQSVPPFYIIDENNISGTAVEHVNFLFEQPALQSVDIEFVLKPWQRCLIDLEQNTVDLLIAGYSEKRSQIGVFPNAMGFERELSTFSSTQICFVKRKSDNWLWTGEGITNAQELVLGLEPGFLIPESHKLDSITQHFPIWYIAKKYELLKQGRVDALLTVCGVMEQKLIPDQDKISSELQVVYPPFIDSPVYLMFSKGFYKDSPELAKLIIQTSNQLAVQDVIDAISK